MKSLDLLKSELDWRSDKIKMFGKIFDQKRLVAWYGDEGISYSYSRIQMVTKVWTPELLKIRNKIDREFHIKFNSCLINLYRDGNDHMSYHSDNEKELGVNPQIFSITLGGPRDFYLKHNSKLDIVKLSLGHGDLLIMKGATQKYWKHSLPKRKNVTHERMNLTFRQIY